ncbi:serpin family protein [Tsukamurella soli]|uniref:serpin family protein n=1 Tax=Tsukamurella soli TaxID=644556 RepID=UPI0031E76C62
MRRGRRALAAALAATLVAGLGACGSPSITTPVLALDRSKATFREVGVDETRDDIAALVASATRIGASLVRGGSGSGVVVSPYAVLTLLAELRAGAGGATAAQLDGPDGADLSALHDPGRAMAALIGQVEQWSGDPGSVSASAPPASPLFQVGRALLVPSAATVTHDYLDTLSRWYDTGVYPADFGGPRIDAELGEWAAVNSASTWTATPLRVDTATRAALLATAYLAAAWRYPFQLSATSSAPFTDADGSTADVPTMHGTVLARVARTAGFEAVQLDYGTTLGLQIVLPPRGRPLDDVATSGALTAARLALAAAPVAAHAVALPRWRTVTWTHLPGSLAVSSLFAGDADLPGLGTGVHISDARSGATLTVGEKGTAMAQPAASSAPATPTAGVPAGPGPDPFAVDRAFVYSVVDTATGLPLLIGTVRTPVTD